MTEKEFTESYGAIRGFAFLAWSKAHEEGLAALEQLIDKKAEYERNVFHYGLGFVVDGVDSRLIYKILTNIVEQETDAKMKILKTIEKEAVLSIQRGDSNRTMFSILNSLTPFSLSEDGAIFQGKSKDTINIRR